MPQAILWLRCLYPIQLTIHTDFSAKLCFKLKTVHATCLLSYDHFFSTERVERKVSLLSTCIFHTFHGLACFHYLIISVVILAYCTASKSKLHDCFGLLCEVLEVCFSVICWAEYSGKIRGLGGGEGAQVSQAQDACDSEAFSQEF